MNIPERLWRYCPRPIRRKRSLLQRLAVTLHLPNLSNLRTPNVPAFFTSLAISVSLFYFGMFIFVCLANGTTAGITVLENNPIVTLLSTLAFAFLWATTSILLSATRKRGARTLFLIVLLLVIIPAGLAGGVNSGLFDSVTMTSGSLLDLHRCVVYVTVKNNGLRDIKITRIEVAGIIMRDYSPESGSLKRGQTYTFTINYLDPQVLHAGSRITPTTFNEQKYPVIIHTEGVLTYRFEIQAGFSEHEQINSIRAKTVSLTETTIDGQDTVFPSLNVTFDAPPLTDILVYSVSVGNLTLTVDPPSWVRGVMVYSSPNFLYQLDLYYLNGHYVADGVYEFPSVIPSQSLDSPIFTAGQTCSVTVRTMENNNYTTSVTLVK